MNPALTIIVPAYKIRSLRETLESITSQSSNAYRLLVVDDGSPYDVESIVACVPTAEYIRFDENMGGRDLVAHWNRCVELAETEYVWMFSDDDLMDSRCVEAFLHASETYPNHRVYRFNTRVEDLEIGVVTDNPPHPEQEQGGEFLRAKIAERRNSYMPEYIFTKKAFCENQHSFVTFPLAWNSDDASWALFAGDQTIRTIQGPRITWRYGGGNISSDMKNGLQKILADMEFAAWARAVFGIENRLLDGMRAHRIRHHYRLPFFPFLKRSWWSVASASGTNVVIALLWSSLLNMRFRSGIRRVIRSIKIALLHA